MKHEQRPHILRRLARTFWPDLRVHRRSLAGAYVFRLISVGAAVFLPWPLKVIIDNVIAARPLPEVLRKINFGTTSESLVLWMTVLFLLVTIVGAISNSLEKNISARVRERLTLQLRDRLLAHLQTLPPTFRTGDRSGELVLRLVDDSDLFVRNLTKTLPLLFQHVSTLVLILAVMLWLDVRLAAFGLLLMPTLFIIIRHYSRRLWAASREKRRQEGKVSGLAQEIIRGLPVIQALGSERHTRKRFERVNRKRLKSGVEETSVAVGMEQTLQITQGFALALTTGIGALLVIRHQLTIGELTVFTAYVAQLLKPVEKLNDLSETTGRGLAGGERLLALLEQRAGVEDALNAVEVGRARGLMEFRDVCFAYPDDDARREFVLRGVNMRLSPRSLTVLIGQSGAGKSTIMSLMVRLFDPSSGEVLLDGKSLREIRIRSLRAQIAIMTQETHLFSGTLREALIPDGIELRAEKLWDALALVALDDFVRELPKQLDTKLGEDAFNLSGGQRQRLSLARAFLMDRPILLLDEPLANVDEVSAAVIIKALQRLRATRTCLAITHQPSLLDYADVVYRLADGQVIEEESAEVNHETRQATLPVVRRMAR
jgi:ATP-binding cassette subfamily B protein